MADKDSSASTDELRAGIVLRKTREAAGLSQREVADKLHLLPKQIEALESDNYAYFSAAVFCKGYLRAYGKLLGIDSEPLLQSYVQQCPASQGEVIKSSKFKAQPIKGHSTQYWSFFTLVIVVFVLWLLSGNGVDGQSVVGSVADDVAEQASDISARNPAGSVALQEAVSPELKRHEPTANIISADNLGDLPLPVTDSLPVENSTENPAQLAAIAVSVIDENTPQAVKPAQAADEKPQGLLSFHFTDDCWVKITDSDGQLIFANLKRAEDTLEVSGRAPFRVLLGYAPGVSLDYNGQPVTIKINRENNSAIFRVGS